MEEKRFAGFKRKICELLNKPFLIRELTLMDIAAALFAICFGIIFRDSVIGGFIGGILLFCYGYMRHVKFQKDAQDERIKNEEQDNGDPIVEETDIEFGMVFKGRKGNKFYWYPFGNKESRNNNIMIIEGDDSIRGDSLRFMQEFSNSMIKLDDRVCILDAGRDFENQAKQIGKKYINLSQDVCINPFSVINRECEIFERDTLILITSLIDMMVSGTKEEDQEDREKDDITRYLIEEGVEEVWKKKRRNTGIDDLIEWMQQDNDKYNERKKYIANRLLEYGSKGKYGRYFNRGTNIKLDSNFNAISFKGVEAKIRKVIVAGALTYIHAKDGVYQSQYYKGLILRDLMSEFKSKEDKLFIENYIRLQRRLGKGVIANVNPENEIYKIATMLSDNICCLNHDKKAIKNLAEDNIAWDINEEDLESKGKEYLITAIRSKQMAGEKYSVACILRGSIESAENNGSGKKVGKSVG